MTADPENTLEEELLAEVQARSLAVPEVDGETVLQELLDAVAESDEES